MADTPADVIRVEGAYAGIAALIREKQNGYATDTFQIAHKFAGGTTKYWTADDQDLNRTGKLTLTKTTQQFEIEYDASNQLDVTVNATGDATFATTRHMFLTPGTLGVVTIGTVTAQTWKTGTMEAVLQLGTTSAVVGNGNFIYLVTGAYYDETDGRWETTGGVNSTYVVLSEGITVSADNNDTGGGAGDAITWIELFHAKGTGVATGEFVVNEGGGDVDFRCETDNEEYALWMDASADVGHVSVPLYLTDNQTAATAKWGLMRCWQYDSAGETEGFIIIGGYGYEDTGTEYNVVAIGGGDADSNACTSINFYVAANEQTRAGTMRMQLQNAKLLMSVPIDMGTSQLLLADGAVGAPGLVWDGDLNSGLYHIGADNIGMSIAGTLSTEWEADGDVSFKENIKLDSVKYVTWNGDLGAGDASIGHNGSHLLIGATTGNMLLSAAGGSDVRCSNDFAIYGGRSLFIEEMAGASADRAGYGQFWVDDAAPNVPMFTDDAGTDFYIDITAV